MTRSRRDLLRELLRSPVPAFLLLSLFLLVVHEPWRDEAQPWLIVRDAPSLFQALDSEGSPGLWYALQWPLVELGLPFLAARVLHLVAATAALSVFVLHAPFSKLEKWLFALGYFVVYEYGAITRSYVLTMLLLFVVASLWRERHGRPLVHGGLLFLLANANAHGTLLAGILAVAFVAETLLRRPAFSPRLAAALALPFVGAGLAYLQVTPAPDLAPWRTATLTTYEVGGVYSASFGVLHALLPLPDLAAWRWGRMWLTSFDGTMPWESLARLAATTWLLSLLLVRRGVPLLLYVAGSAALVATYYTKAGVSSQMRHHGLLFVWLIFCVWLARLDAKPAPEASPNAARRIADRVLRRAAPVLLVLLLATHASATLPAVVHDAREDFSGGPPMASYLVENDMLDDKTLLAVYPSYVAAPLLVALPDRDAVAYLPQTGADGSYVRWTTEDVETLGLGLFAMMDRAEAAARERGDARVVFVTSIAYDPGEGDRVRRVAGFPGLERSDSLYLYVWTVT